MPSVCPLGLHITVNYIQNTECFTTAFYANFMLRDNLLHSSVFESAAIKRFRSDEINQLQSNKY